QPEAIGSTRKPRLLQELLDAAWVIRIARLYGAEDRVVVIRVWMRIDLSQQPLADRNDVREGRAVDREGERLADAHVGRQLGWRGELGPHLQLLALRDVGLPDDAAAVV